MSSGYSGDDISTNPEEKAQRKKHSRSHPWFDFPPAFEKRLLHVSTSLKKGLNPANLLIPLPPALKYSLTRNFGFVTSVFTQFTGNEGVNNVQQSIGIGK
jgi:hypothetical protein